MVTIPTVYGYPSFDGRYNGEMVYDANSFCMYVWTITQYNTVGSWVMLGQQGLTGPTGPAGMNGLDADETKLNALAENQLNLILRNKLQDLVLTGTLKKAEFIRLTKMLNSGHADTLVLAETTIRVQHSKVFGYEDPDLNLTENEI